MAGTDEGSRLDSWKEIANYLGRDVRTVRRWEKERALPIHRLPGEGRRAVFAFRVEIDEWLRGTEPEAVEASGPAEIEVLPGDQRESADSAQAQTPPNSPEAISVAATVRPVPAAPAQAHPRSHVSRKLAMGFGSARMRWGAPVFLAAVGVAVILGLSSRGRERIFAYNAAAKRDAAKAALVAKDSGSDWKPEVLSVQFSGEPRDLGMYVNGLGFGEAPAKLPFTGDMNSFRIGDVSCYAKAPGTCEAGYIGDDAHLTYLSWNNTQILFSHFKLAAPGDAIELSVWNPQAKNGQAAAVWGGNVPPIRPGTPRISSVTFSGNGRNLHITIRGANFGSAPPGVPGKGNTQFLEIGDYAYHSPKVILSTFFRAGYQNDAVVCGITLDYRSWSDKEIEIVGFGGSYGQNGMVVRRGDPVSIDLWNTKNRLATAWGGRIP
jgi:hypothetical protein